MLSSPAPLVSVITPAYNAAEFLGEAVESVRQQTHRAWELVLVVDEGSRDGTAGAAEAWRRKDSRVRVFHQEHVRMAAARNFGITKASGKYLAFLDADNLFLPRKLEQQVAHLEAHPDCGVCYGRVYHFYADKPDVLYGNRHETLAPRGNVFREALRTMFINLLAALVRRDAVASCGAFPEGWPACDDHYFWANLAYRGVPFCPQDVAIGLERLHRGSDSRRAAHALDSADGVLRMADVLEGKMSPEEREKYGAHLAALRRSWRWRRTAARMFLWPVVGPLFLKAYHLRRERAFYPVGTRAQKGIRTRIKIPPPAI